MADQDALVLPAPDGHQGVGGPSGGCHAGKRTLAARFAEDIYTDILSSRDVRVVNNKVLTDESLPD